MLDLLAGRSEPILVLVRGDAAAIVGRTAEAARDHAAAAQVVTDTPDEAAADSAETSGDPVDSEVSTAQPDDPASAPTK